MNCSEKKRLRGFTILELMIVLGISSILLIGIFSILRVGSEQSQLSETKMLLQDTAREAVYKMVQEIRQSAPSRITIGAGGASLQFSVPDPAALIAPDYSVNWTGAHTILYARGGTGNTQILRTDLSSNKTSVIANDITGLLFTGNATPPTVITVQISAQRTLTSGRTLPATPLLLTAQAEVRNP